MIPTFFPFTHMAEPTAAALSGLFRRVVLYRPSDDPLPEPLQRQADDGFLEIRTPVRGDERHLKAAVAEYEAWAERHGSSPLAHFKSRQGKVPFFEESSLSRIRAEIKRWSEAKPEEKKPDPVFAARLFLSVAQAFDRQEWEVNRSLTGLRDLEASLLKSIHGEQDAIRPATALPAEDLGRHMPHQRIWAWSCLWSRDPAASPLWVTDSREIFDAILEPVFDSPRLDRFDIAWPPPPAAGEMQDGLLRWLTDLSLEKGEPSPAPSSAEPGNGGKQMVLRLFRAGGSDPLEVLSRAAGGIAAPAGEEKKAASSGVPIVAFMDISG